MQPGSLVAALAHAHRGGGGLQSRGYRRRRAAAAKSAESVSPAAKSAKSAESVSPSPKAASPAGPAVPPAAESVSPQVAANVSSRKRRWYENFGNSLRAGWRSFTNRLGRGWRRVKRGVGNTWYSALRGIDSKYHLAREYKRDINGESSENRRKRLKRARNFSRRHYAGRELPGYLQGNNRSANYNTYLGELAGNNKSNFSKYLKRVYTGAMWGRKFGGLSKKLRRGWGGIVEFLRSLMRRMSQGIRSFFRTIFNFFDRLENSVLDNTRVGGILRRIYNLGLKNGAMAVGAGYLIWIFLPLPIKFVMLATFLLLRVRDSRKDRGETNAAVNVNDMLERALQWVRVSMGGAVENACRGMTEAVMGVRASVVALPAVVAEATAATGAAAAAAAAGLGRGGLAVADALGPAALAVAQHYRLVPNRVAEAEEHLRAIDWRDGGELEARINELAEASRAPPSAAVQQWAAEVEKGAAPGVFTSNSPVFTSNSPVAYMYDVPPVNMFSPANQAYARAHAAASAAGASAEEAAAAGRAAAAAVK